MKWHWFSCCWYVFGLPLIFGRRQSSSLLNCWIRGVFLLFHRIELPKFNEWKRLFYYSTKLDKRIPILGTWIIEFSSIRCIEMVLSMPIMLSSWAVLLGGVFRLLFEVHLNLFYIDRCHIEWKMALKPSDAVNTLIILQLAWDSEFFQSISRGEATLNRLGVNCENLSGSCKSHKIVEWTTR